MTWLFKLDVFMVTVIVTITQYSLALVSVTSTFTQSQTSPNV